MLNAVLSNVIFVDSYGFGSNVKIEKNYYRKDKKNQIGCVCARKVKIFYLANASNFKCYMEVN